MRNKRILQGAIAAVVSLARGFSPLRTGLRILIYHSVGGSAIGDYQGIFSMSHTRFHSHVQLLADMKNCQAVSLAPLNIQHRLLQVVVTFDDGYLDNLRIAAPLLITHGIPFTVFVTSDFIKCRSKGFLLPEDLKELAGLPGVTIGAHGKSHQPLTVCNDRDLEMELSNSKQYLEDLLGRSVSTVAYPYGAADIRVRDKAKQLGYDMGLCARFDINMADRDPLMLCRCGIERDDNTNAFRQKLLGNWDWLRWRLPDPLSQKRTSVL